MFLTFIDEPDAIQRLRDRIGVENILWSSDYPHPVSIWPSASSRRFLADDDRDAIVGGNAARVWRL